MKKISLLTLVLFAAVTLNGCASPFPQGLLYTEIKMPIAAGEGGSSYSKIGVSKSTSIFGLVATGDASIKAAVADGGIKTIKFVDYEAKSTLAFISHYTTTVYGD